MMMALSALSLLCSLLIPSVYGHATLNFPRSRNYIARFMLDPPEHYCPYCGQGNGGVPGVCGDPFQDIPAFDFFRDKGHYGVRTHDFVEGQIIETEIEMHTNHGGRVSFAVCPLPADQATQDCFTRPEHMLRRVDDNPLYDNKLYYYFKESATLGSLVRTRWRLPPGISCPNGCLFQWWWLGYQKCYVGCEGPEDDVPGECDFNPLNPSVTTCPNGILSTEQFINCADIRILPATTKDVLPPANNTGSGGNDGTKPNSGSATPASSEAPTPKPDTSPSPSPSPTLSPSPSPASSPSPSPASPSPTPEKAPAQAVRGNTKASTLPTSPPTTPQTTTSHSPEQRPEEPSPSSQPVSQPASQPVSQQENSNQGGACPEGVASWACEMCDKVTSAPHYSNLKSHCYKCVAANPGNHETCQECFKSSIPLEHSVAKGCLSCASDQQQPGWSCRKQCAEFAPDAGAMGECSQCLVDGSDSWGCAVCMSVAGSDPQARQDCMKCVVHGANSYACGACATKRGSKAQQACFACLRTLKNRDTSDTCLHG